MIQSIKIYVAPLHERSQKRFEGFGFRGLSIDFMILCFLFYFTGTNSLGGLNSETLKLGLILGSVTWFGRVSDIRQYSVLGRHKPADKKY